MSNLASKAAAAFRTVRSSRVQFGQARRVGLLALLVVCLGWFPFAQPSRITLYLIGDSTMANKPDPEHNPERGWGQSLPEFLDSNVVVSNHAVNGRSTRSFINEGRWTAVRSQLHKGDVVIIQFGHNDEKREDSTRYADANGAYRDNLLQFVRETKAAGAIPILMTPIVRRQWSESGVLTDTHGAYPDAVRALASSQSIKMIDMEKLTGALLRSYGVEPSKQLFVWTTQGQFAAFPAARQDNTHLSPRGATAVAKLAASGLMELGEPLAAHIRILK